MDFFYKKKPETASKKRKKRLERYQRKKMYEDTMDFFDGLGLFTKQKKNNTQTLRNKRKNWRELNHLIYNTKHKSLRELESNYLLKRNKILADLKSFIKSKIYQTRIKKTLRFAKKIRIDHKTIENIITLGHILNNQNLKNNGENYLNYKNMSLTYIQNYYNKFMKSYPLNNEITINEKMILNQILKGITEIIVDKLKVHKRTIKHRYPEYNAMFDNILRKHNVNLAKNTKLSQLHKVLQSTKLSEFKNKNAHKQKLSDIDLQRLESMGSFYENVNSLLAQKSLNKKQTLYLFQNIRKNLNLLNYSSTAEPFLNQDYDALKKLYGKLTKQINNKIQNQGNFTKNSAEIFLLNNLIKTEKMLYSTAQKSKQIQTLPVRIKFNYNVLRKIYSQLTKQINNKFRNGKFLTENSGEIVTLYQLIETEKNFYNNLSQGNNPNTLPSRITFNNVAKCSVDSKVNYYNNRNQIIIKHLSKIQEMVNESLGLITRKSNVFSKPNTNLKTISLNGQRNVKSNLISVDTEIKYMINEIRSQQNRLTCEDMRLIAKILKTYILIIKSFMRANNRPENLGKLVVNLKQNIINGTISNKLTYIDKQNLLKNINSKILNPLNVEMAMSDNNPTNYFGFGKKKGNKQNNEQSFMSYFGFGKKKKSIQTKPRKL